MNQDDVEATAFGYGWAIGACCGAFAVMIIFYLIGVRLA